MALMTAQAVTEPGMIPTFAAPTVSDTITYDTGLVLYVKNGATICTVTVVVPGNQPISGAVAADCTAAFANAERAFKIHQGQTDPATGLVTVTYSAITTVTVALLKI